MPLALETRWVEEIAVVRCRGRIVAGEDVCALRAEVERLMRETRRIICTWKKSPAWTAVAW